MKITELFQNREFVVSAEVGPPKGIHIDGMVEEAKKYLTGVHFVNVTDNQSSVMRLGSLATCKVLKDAGLNPIFQLTCRDRNRIALQSDLLSAAMLGIDNILCLTGDHTKLGDHPQAKPVFDLDSVSLLYAASMLETGKDLGGNELVGEPPKFAKGAVVSPCSDSVDAQLVKMERKVKAGAEFFQTQAVFEPEKFIKFMEAAKQFGKPVQVGIIIPKSAGMCKFMNNNVAGVHIPDELIAELQADKEKTSDARKALQDFVSSLQTKKENDRKNHDDYIEKKLKQLEDRKMRRNARKGKPQDDGQEQATEQFRGGALKVGEKVRIKDNGMAGEVIRVSNKAVTVAIGNITSKMPLDRVERISSNEYKAAVRENIKPRAAQDDSGLRERRLAFSPELDVRGERVSDALDIVVHYIDDAIMLNIGSVRIIHGKGTGALRDELQKYLRTIPGVTSVHDEQVQFGGSGVTIVTLG